MENAEQVSVYWVWGTDHVVYGAVESSVLVEWVKAGRLAADHWVFSEPGNQWRKAAELPELATFFRSAPAASLIGTAAGGRGEGIAGSKPEVLRRIRIFRGMDVRQIESCLRYMEVVRYPQFSQIVRKGERGDAMYVVLEGELRALTMVDGKESTLATIAAGESFGEISLLDQGPRSSDVVANQDSVLLRIRAASFELLLREAPALAVPFLLALSRSAVARVRGLTKRHEDSVHFIRTTHGAS
jgi:hypothetical protein